MTPTQAASNRLARQAYIRGQITFEELDRIATLINRNDTGAVREIAVILLAAAKREG